MPHTFARAPLTPPAAPEPGPHDHGGFPGLGVASQIRNPWPGQRGASPAGHRVDGPAV